MNSTISAVQAPVAGETRQAVALDFDRKGDSVVVAFRDAARPDLFYRAIVHEGKVTDGLAEGDLCLLRYHVPRKRGLLVQRDHWEFVRRIDASEVEVVYEYEVEAARSSA